MLKKLIPISGIFVFIFLSGTVSELSSVSVNLKSNLIILTGTLLCCIVSYPARLFSQLGSSIKQAFSKEEKNFDGIINRIETLSVIHRTQGTIKLDEASRQIDNTFLKMGIEMIVDGYDRFTIFKTLERRYDNYLKVKRSETELIGTIIKLLPVFGFVGTIIGLINVLNNMGSPELIGKGVATALLTTFYGLLYANVVFLPISKKLTEKNRRDSMTLALIIEGVLDIADKVNSKALAYRLRYCIDDFYRDDHMIEKDTSGIKPVLPPFKPAFKKGYIR